MEDIIDLTFSPLKVPNCINLADTPEKLPVVEKSPVLEKAEEPEEPAEKVQISKSLCLEEDDEFASFSTLGLQRALLKYGIQPKKTKAQMHSQLTNILEKVSARQASGAMDIRTAIMNDEPLYRRILQYDMVEFTEFEECAKKANVKISASKLRVYLKSQGVAFREIRKR